MKSFYHFTDTRNLASIRDLGLLPFAELQSRGIVVQAPAGNDWSHEADERWGLDNYVHLCLMDEHPMEYQARKDGRIVDSRFLQISPAVLAIDGIRFAADIANKSGVPLLSLEEACETMDFEVIYDRTDWKDPDIQQRRQIAKRYELLVPEIVPINLITGA